MWRINHPCEHHLVISGLYPSLLDVGVALVEVDGVEDVVVDMCYLAELPALDVYAEQFCWTAHRLLSSYEFISSNG